MQGYLRVQVKEALGVSLFSVRIDIVLHPVDL